jgi:hypothetical protein
VGGDGAEVDVRSIHRQAPNGLRRVDVQQHPPVAADSRDVGDRLHRPDLTVGPADRYDRRVRSECRGDVVSRHPSGGIDRQPGDRRTAALQLTHRPEHRQVLDRRRDDVPSRDHGSEQRQIVRFRGPTSEAYRRRRYSEGVGNGPARVLQRSTSRPSGAVRTRWIPCRRIEHRQHGGTCDVG